MRACGFCRRVGAIGPRADARRQVRVLPERRLKRRAALAKSCRDRGFQAAVAVVDRMGVVQVLLRDRFAGPHTPDMATAKAYTAASFRTNTTELAEASQAGQTASGIRHRPRRRGGRRHDDRGGRVAARRDRRVGRARRPRGRRVRGCRDRRDPGRYRTMKALDKTRHDRAGAVRRRVRGSRRRAAAPCAADTLVGRGSRALSVRADRAA